MLGIRTSSMISTHEAHDTKYLCNTTNNFTPVKDVKVIHGLVPMTVNGCEMSPSFNYYLLHIDVMVYIQNNLLGYIYNMIQQLLK